MQIDPAFRLFFQQAIRFLFLAGELLQPCKVACTGLHLRGEIGALFLEGGDLVIDRLEFALLPKGEFEFLRRAAALLLRAGDSCAAAAGDGRRAR